MNTILKTTQLEYAKSSLLIDLVRHQTGSLYIKIAQHIQNHKRATQTIRLNPTVLSDLI